MAQTLMVSLLVIGTLIGIPAVVGEGPGDGGDCKAEEPKLQPAMDAMCDIVEVVSACQLKHTVGDSLSSTKPPKVRDSFVKVWIPIGAGSTPFIEDNVFGPLGLDDEQEWIDHIIKPKVSHVVWVVSVAGSNNKADCSL